MLPACEMPIRLPFITMSKLRLLAMGRNQPDRWCITYNLMPRHSLYRSPFVKFDTRARQHPKEEGCRDVDPNFRFHVDGRDANVMAGFAFAFLV